MFTFSISRVGDWKGEGWKLGKWKGHGRKGSWRLEGRTGEMGVELGRGTGEGDRGVWKVGREGEGWMGFGYLRRTWWGGGSVDRTDGVVVGCVIGISLENLGKRKS